MEFENSNSGLSSFIFQHCLNLGSFPLIYLSNLQKYSDFLKDTWMLAAFCLIYFVNIVEVSGEAS